MPPPESAPTRPAAPARGRDRLAAALEAPSRRAMLRLLRPRRDDLGMADVQRLAARLAAMDEPRLPLRVAVLRTYASEPLAPYWKLEALLQGFALDLYDAPYGALLQECQPGSGLAAHQPDLTCLLLRWEDVAPPLAGPVMAGDAAERRRLVDDAVARVEQVIAGVRGVVSGLVVVTLLPPFAGPELGAYDAMIADSEAAFRGALKAALAERIAAGLPSVYLCDLDALVDQLGRRGAFEARMWHMARFPFSVSGAQSLVRRLLAYGVLLKHPKAKVIALDADNTLWGGIVGEDGPDGIKLGPDYPGSGFVAFQRRLLAYQQRGFLLVLNSKNNLADVQEILTKHPHQVLRPEHFAAMRVNWQPKPQNLRELAQELNLGLEAFVFVDDSDHECGHVEAELPQVTVVQTPHDALLVAESLEDLPQLEILGLTAEDRARTAMYAQERERKERQASAGNLEEYLQSLDMVMSVGLDDARHAPRIAQLTQKTNQFNVTTRRYTEADVRARMADPAWIVAHFSLADAFGDSGLVGVTMLRLEGDTAEVDTLLMSCRVIGRRAETAFLDHLLDELAARGVRTVRAAFIPTAKNALVARFWDDHGFTPVGEGAFTLDLGARPARTPPPIRIQRDGAAPASAAS